MQGYAVGRFTLALINARLDQAKTRSGSNWFLLSLLIGPFATFAIVVMEKLTG
jgi:hypothetical protein